MKWCQASEAVEEAVEEAMGNENSNAGDASQDEETDWNEYTKPILTLFKLISVRFTIYIAFNSGSNLLLNLLEMLLPDAKNKNR